jgi:O-antigen ligase
MTRRIAVLIGIISIATSPWTTYDPINPLKFLLLAICGSTCLVFLTINRKEYQFNKVMLSLVVIFISQTLISTVFSGSSITQGIFGYYGRNFGLLTWIMLFALMIYFSIAQEFQILLNSLLIVGVISVFYSYLQYFGIDPAPWANNFNAVIGFLGNPNFQSSFLGLFLIIVFSSLTQKFRTPTYLILYLILFAATIQLILKSGSIQGLFVSLVGVGSLAVYFFYAKKYYRIFWSLIVIGSIFLLNFVFAVVGLGPLSSYVHKGTLAIRGDYWLAAISMAKANLLTGVGPDQYGTWYRFYRHQDALTRVNSEVVSDSAHNGYLDIAANLGFVAFLSYILLILYAIIFIGRSINRHSKIDRNHATLVALFMGFQSQFLISPNQIGLAVWGWAFLGAIYGYQNPEFGKKVIQAKISSDAEKRRSNLNQLSLALAPTIGTLIGFALAFPIFNSSMQFRTALVKADAIKVIAAANVWPRNEDVLSFSTNLLLSNGLQEQGLKLVNSALQEFPNSFELLRSKKSYKWISETEMEEIQLRLHRLDPLNPEYASKG